MDLRKTLERTSARNWLILAGLFTSLYAAAISAKLSSWMMYAVLMPLIAYAMMKELFSREYSGTPTLRVMLFTVAWVACSSLINRRVDERWILTFWFLLICWFYLLFVPKDTTREELRREVFSLGMMLICIQLVLCLLALYSIFSGKVVQVPRIGKIGIQQPGVIGETIYIMEHYNLTGRMAWFCILFALYGILSRKNKVLRVFLIFAIVVFSMVLTHTQSRTSYIGLAAALGLVSFRGVCILLQKRPWRVFAGLLAAAMAFGITLGGLNLIYKADIALAKALKADQRTEVAVGDSQEIVSRVVTDGQFEMLNNGRGVIWLETLKYLKDHPRYLLTGIGGTISDSYNVIKEERTNISPFNHYHNAYLAVLATGGIPLLAAVLAFLCLILKPCWRVFTRRETTECAGQFILPVFLFTQLITCIPEEGIFLRPSYANLIFYFLCGIILHESFLSGKDELSSAGR